MRASPAPNLRSVPVYPATTLPGLLKSVVDIYALMEDAPTIHIGERYKQMEGAPRRILILPDEQPGKWGDPKTVGSGHVGSVSQQCAVMLWGSETLSDLDRYDDAVEMAYDFINVLKRLAPGCIESGLFGRNIISDILTYGEEVQLFFSYTGGVPRNDAIWNLALPAPSDTKLSPPAFTAPPGTLATTVEIGVTMNPEEAE